MKIRVCVDCGAEMSVHRNSGKLRCDACRKIHDRQKAKDWYTKQPRECRKEASRRSAQKLKDNLRLGMISRAKTRSNKIGLPFDLSVEDIIIPEVCPILGTKFVPGTEYTTSLDRIRPELGYVKGNVQVISMKANAMKNSANETELLCFAKWVMENVENY